jgi:hypothetical protein
MVAFLFLYEDLCGALEATWAIGFGEVLDQFAPGAGPLWRRLQSGVTPPTGEQASADAAWGDRPAS